MTARTRDRFKRSILVRWIRRYLAVALIPILLFVFFAVACAALVWRSTVSASSAALFSVQRELDSVFLSIDQMSEDVLLNDSLVKVAASPDAPSMDLYQATGSIRSLFPSQSPLIDLVLYDPAHDRYINQNQWGSLNDFFLRDEFDLGWSRERLASVFGVQERGTRVLNADRTLYGGTVQRRMLVIRPLNLTSSGPFHGWLLAVLVDGSSVLSPELAEYRDLIICQQGGASVVYDFTEGEEVDPAVLRAADDRPRYTKGRIVTARVSAATGFKYLILVDARVYLHTVRLFVGFLLLYMASVAVAGTVLIRRWVRREWEDYERAIEEAGTPVNRDEEASSAYVPFVSSVRGLKEREEGLQALVHVQTESLRQRTIGELVQQGGSVITPEALRECGIDLVGPWFVVLLAEGNGDRTRLAGLMEARSMLVLPFSSTHGTAMILNMAQEKAWDDEAGKALEDLVRSGDGAFAAIAASDPHRGIPSIGQAYLEAINVLEYEKNGGLHEFLTYRDVVEVTGKVHFTFSTQDELELERAIAEGDGLQAQKLVDALVEAGRKAGCSPQNLRYLLFSIAGTVVRAAGKLDERYQQDLPDLTIPPILLSDSFERSHRDVDGMIARLCKAVGQVRARYADPSAKSWAVYRQALAEIQTRYGDTSLNVSQLADAAQVSIVYLSRAFKKHHSMNISEYISRYRIFMAKKLLSEGAMVGEVAKACGFGSLRTFLRVFKHYEQVTPGAWKEASGGEGAGT